LRVDQVVHAHAEEEEDDAEVVRVRENVHRNWKNDLDKNDI
jgi:hypothetical protein